MRACLALSLMASVVACAGGCRGSSQPGRGGGSSEAGREGDVPFRDSPSAGVAAVSRDAAVAIFDPESPPATIEQAVAKAIGKPLSDSTLLVKDWPQRPGSSLAVVSPALGRFGVPEEVEAHIVLLEHGDAGISAVAIGKLVPDVPTNPAWTLSQPAFKLDLAPYEIRKGQFAFGIRFSHAVEFGAGENDSEQLYLFRQDADRLVDILHVTVAETDEQRGPGDLFESASIVVVAPETTQGFHDILVRTRSTAGPLTDEPQGRPRTTRRLDERWRWTGSQYERAR